MKKFKTYVTIENIKETQRIDEMTNLIREYFGSRDLRLMLNEKVGPRSKDALIKIIKRVMDNPKTTADQLETILKNVTMPLADKALNNLFQDIASWGFKVSDYYKILKNTCLTFVRDNMV